MLDDATASVDAATEARIRLGLREAMRGRTTVIIAHRLSTIALADEIVVLEQGRVAARGGHDDLIGTSDVYREIYEHGRLDRPGSQRGRLRCGSGSRARASSRSATCASRTGRGRRPGVA